MNGIPLAVRTNAHFDWAIDYATTQDKIHDEIMALSKIIKDYSEQSDFLVGFDLAIPDLAQIYGRTGT
jgi:hypothetical protein